MDKKVCTTGIDGHPALTCYKQKKLSVTTAFQFMVGVTQLTVYLYISTLDAYGYRFGSGYFDEGYLPLNQR